MAAILLAPTGIAAPPVPNACSLLTDAEAVSLIARGWPTYNVEPEVYELPQASVCSYPGGEIAVWVGPNSLQGFEKFLKTRKQDQEPRQQLSGVGDKAYVFYPRPTHSGANQGPFVVATVGPHTVTVSLDAHQGQADGPMGTMCRDENSKLSASESKDCVWVLADKSEDPKSLQPAAVELAKTVVARVRAGKFTP